MLTSDPLCQAILFFTKPRKDGKPTTLGAHVVRVILFATQHLVKRFDGCFRHYRTFVVGWQC